MSESNIKSPVKFARRIEVHAHKEPWVMDAISLRITSIHETAGRHEVSLAAPLIMTALTEEDMACEQPATLRLRADEAQQMMDELYRVGVRPSDGAGSVGQLAAMEYHLEDMRRLVFRSKRL